VNEITANTKEPDIIPIDYNIQHGLTSGVFGAIDAFTQEGISGWVIDMSQPNTQLTVKAYIAEKSVAFGLTYIFRRDISDLVQHQASCGFLLKWDVTALCNAAKKLSGNALCQIVVKVDGNERPISTTNLPSISEIKKWAETLTIKSQNEASKKHLATSLTPKNIAAHIESIIGDTLNPKDSEKNDVKLIAYYLPQFHPIHENDEWWGKGFTEWTNVTKAEPYFDNHHQPHIPSELGYYDLRLPEVREAQAKLAKEYGIYGFCYYYYWFEGRRLLERPLQEVFDSGKPDFPFCICWANENWSRRWDGSENEILVQQVHNEQTDEDFIHDVIPLFKDPRYIKMNGAPLLIVYRISLMPNPDQTAKVWREICAANGIPEIHLCIAETFGSSDPRPHGFNTAVQFPPHGMVAGLENDKIENLAEGYTGNIYDFKNVIQYELAKELPVYKQFPGVMTGWDNTARKKKAGNVFINSSPELYEIWLRGAIDRAKQSLPDGEQFVFINAWNEWAEGTHLEPDQKNGRGYLEATRRALIGHSDWHTVLKYAEQLPELAGEAKKHFLADIRFALERLTTVNTHLLSIMGDNGIPKFWTTMKPGLPYSFVGLKYFEAGVSNLERLNHYSHFNGQRVVIDSYQKLWIEGWAYHDVRQVLASDTPTYIVLENTVNQETYFAPTINRIMRTDISDYHQNTNVTFSGIKTFIDVSTIPVGSYHLSVAVRFEKRVIMTPFKVEVKIV
jgi:hypothetical protein